MTQINREPLLDNKIAIFIDSNVDDYQQLIQGAIASAQVFILNSHQDGVEQISQILSQNSYFTEAHIVSHGAPGCLYLGNTNLGLDTLNDYISQLQPWQAIDTLLLYGCNVAAGDAGAEFIERLHHITGAKIAASAKRTGSSALGGDWNLEITTTGLDAAIAFNEEVQKRYAGVLATIEVTSLNDDGAGSLRAALATINANSDSSNTITFASNLSGGTITLASELLISNTLTIEGSGITISGNNSTRVFRIDADDDANNTADSTEVTLRNLTIANGSSSGLGAGILNEASLTLEDVTVDGNTSTTHAGGIASFGNLTLRRSTISNNSANGNGGGVAINAGTLTVENSTVSGNTATGDGSGIDTRANTATINNSTIAFNNAAGGDGSGIYAGGRNTAATVTVTSSIIAQNGGDDDLFAENGATFGGDNNIIGNADNAGSFSGDNNQLGTAGSPINPLLGSLADNGGATQTHALQDGSPAIDAGANPNSLTTDQRGTAISGTIDIGAFESGSAVSQEPQISVTGDVNPEEGATVVNGEFTFSFSSPFASDTTINFTIAGSAGNPGDYTFDSANSNNITNFSFNAATGAGSFTVAANSGVDSSLRVVPVDDTEVDPNETIELTINAGTGYTIDGNLNVATLTITDDEVVLPTVSVEATDATATEGDANDTGVFTISRDGTDGDLQVTLNISGDAVANEDYTLDSDAAGSTNGSRILITIPDGSNSVTLDVIASDDADTVDETLTLTLDTTVGTYTADTNDNTATVNLVDAGDTNPPLPTVSVAATTATATEGGANGAFTISRTGADNTEDLTVTLDINGNSTAANTDYSLEGGTLNGNQVTVTIPGGSDDATITLTAVDDTEVESDETFQLDVATSADYEIGTNNTATVTLADNDDALPTVSVAATTATATEGGANGAFTVSRAGDTTGDLQVTLDINGNSTAASTDYSLSGGTVGGSQVTVTIPDGDTDVTITLTAEDDTLVENDETFTLDVASNSNYQIDPNSGSGTVTISDNDLPAANTITHDGQGTFTLGGANVGDAVNLKVDLVSSDASFINEIGVIEVAADGSVGDVATEGRILFSALTNNPNISGNFESIISDFTSGANLQFYLINGDGEVLFSSTTNQLDIAESGNNYTLSWEDQPLGQGDGDFDDIVVQVSTTTQTAPLGSASQGQADVLDLSSVVGQNVNVSYTIESDAFFTNTVGLYRIDDLAGTIGGVSAGDAGYAQAALNNKIGNEFSVDGQTTLDVTGSGLYGIYILQNGDATKPIFFAPDANIAGADHFRLLGSNTFGVEDLFLNASDNLNNVASDLDFNDVIVSFDVQVG